MLEQSDTIEIASDLIAFYREVVEKAPQDHQATLSAAAALGRPFSKELLSIVVDGDLGVLDRYVEIGLLSAAGGEYRFTYPDIQQRLSASIPSVEATRIHQKIGEHLETLAGTGLGRSRGLAWHFLRGADREKAFKYTLEAAHDARSLADWHEAAFQLEEALKLAKGGTDHRELFEILDLLADTYENDGEFERAAQHARAVREQASDPLRSQATVRLGRLLTKRGDYSNALQLLREKGSVSDAFRVERLRWEATCHYRNENYDLAESTVQTALQMAAESGDRATIADLFHLMGTLAHARKNPGRALEFLKRSIDLGSPPSLRLKTRNMIGLVHLEMGHFEQARTYFEAAKEDAEAVGDRSNRAVILSNMAIAIEKEGNVERAIEITTRAAREFRLLGNNIERARLLGNVGTCFLELGQWNEAERAYLESLEAYRSPSSGSAASVEVYLAYLRILRGDLDSVQELLAGKTEHADPVTRGWALYNLGLRSLKQRDLQPARSWAERAVETFRQVGAAAETMRSMVLLSEIEMAESHLARAEEVLNEVDQMLEPTPDDYIRAASQKVGSLVAFARGDRKNGRDLMGRAIQGFKRRRDTYEEALCYSHLASYYRLQKKSEKTSLFTSRARDIFNRLGARADLDRLEKLDRPLSFRLDVCSCAVELASCPIHHVSLLVSHLADTEALVRETLHTSVDLVGAERGVMILMDDKTGESKVIDSYNADQSTIEDVAKLSKTVLHQVQESGTMLYTANATEDRRFSDLPSIQSNSILSLICMPLRTKSRILGSLYLDSRSLTDLFSPQDRQMLEIFAGLASLAIENAQFLEETRLANLRLSEETNGLREQLRKRFEFHGIIGVTPQMAQVVQLIKKAAQTRATVLLLGESGVGKELVASAIHYQGPRHKGPFVAFNCAAVPETLLESELFGIEKGVATGVDRRVGKFEQAHGGTLFMDEIGDMPLFTQAKILRVLEERKIERVGSGKQIPVDVRIIAATNRDLRKEVEEKRFREDLFHRLYVLPIPIPPLRERKEDIPVLAEHFLDKIAREHGRKKPRISKPAMRALLEFDWPGNVRQLENVITQSVLLSEWGVLEVGDLPPEILGTSIAALAHDADRLLPLQAATQNYIRMVLEKCGNNKREACRILGISYNTLRSNLG